MARGSKRGQTIEIVSTPLEEFIPVKYAVIGRAEWIQQYWNQDALDAASRVVTVSESSQLHRVKEWMDKHNRHFTDTETTGADKRSGLDPWHPESKLLMLQIGNKDLVFIIDPDLIPEFKEHLESLDILHVLQNGVFDWKYIYAKYKVHINNIFDTMLAEQLLTSGRAGMPVNLMAIARRRPPHRIITKLTRQEFIHFAGRFTKEMVYYAARDVVLLPDIVDDQMAELEKWKMQVVAKDEFNLVPVTGSMELGGVPFSTKVLRLALVYWEKRQASLEAQILASYDTRMTAKGIAPGTFAELGLRHEFDVGSNAQKLEALRELGLSIDDVKRSTLEELDDPIAQLLGEYSACVKINSTYGENMINRINPITKRLSVEFNQLGHGDIEAKAGKATTIATGRYSSDFQQLPKAMNRYDYPSTTELELVKAQFSQNIDSLLKEAGLQ